MLQLKWWFIRTFHRDKIFTCYNDKLNSFKLGDVYLEFTKFYYLKAGKERLFIKHKK